MPGPTNNLQPQIATQISRIDYDRQTAIDDKNPDHVKQNVDTLEAIDRNMRYAAVITSLSTEHGDEYIADVFSDFGQSIPLWSSILIYAGTPLDKFDVGNRVRIKFFPNGSGMIQPIEIPQATGFGQVYMIVDDASPGTQAWDDIRFSP